MSRVINEEYLKELGINLDGLSDDEKTDKVVEIQGAIMERVINKLRPTVPNLNELFDEAQQELKADVEKLHTPKV
jgi:hypothetical protein